MFCVLELFFVNPLMILENCPKIFIVSSFCLLAQECRILLLMNARVVLEHTLSWKPPVQAFLLETPCAGIF
jgi:hypothetical protein